MVMVKRRQFLGWATAMGGSYVLTACGGGGGGAGGNQSAISGAGTTTSSAASGSTATTAVNGAPSAASNGAASGSSNQTDTGSSNSGTPASANGTAIPPAASITDNQGALWTLMNGSVYRSGVMAGNTYNVTLLLWYGNVMYHQGTGGQFYGWNGTTWLACNDPRLGGTSADGTTIPSASYIIDKAGALWTVANGRVLRNNAYVGSAFSVSLLLWYGGKIWYRSTGGQFYVCTDLDQWLPCGD